MARANEVGSAGEKAKTPGASHVQAIESREPRRRRRMWGYVSSVDSGERTIRAFTVSLLLALVIEVWNGESSTSNSSDNNQNDAVREAKRSSPQTELSSRIRASPSCFFIWRLDFTMVASSSYLP